MVIEIHFIWHLFNILGLNPWNQGSVSSRIFKLSALGLENKELLFSMVDCWVGSVYADPSDLRGDVPVFSVPLC